MSKKLLFPVELTASNRHRRDYLISKISPYIDLPKANLLEIGIGNGRFGALLADKVAHYWGIDPVQEYVEIARGNIPQNAKVNYKIGKAEEIPYKRKFNVLFYTNSWHFIRDFKRAISEADRVLQTDGLIAILEPSEESSWVDPRLMKDSSEFSLKAYNNKIKAIKTGKNAILKQRRFELIHKDRDQVTNADLYLLKRSYPNI